MRICVESPPSRPLWLPLVLWKHDLEIEFEIREQLITKNEESNQKTINEFCLKAFLLNVLRINFHGFNITTNL